MHTRSQTLERQLKSKNQMLERQLKSERTRRLSTEEQLNQVQVHKEYFKQLNISKAFNVCLWGQSVVQTKSNIANIFFLLSRVFLRTIICALSYF